MTDQENIQRLTDEAKRANASLNVQIQKQIESDKVHLNDLKDLKEKHQKQLNDLQEKHQTELKNKEEEFTQKLIKLASETPEMKVYREQKAKIEEDAKAAIKKLQENLKASG